MDSKKFLWFLLRLNLIVWLAAAATAIWLDQAEAANEKVLLCHFGETKQVPLQAMQTHLNHGDYLGPCILPSSAPEPDARPLYMMWLLTRDFRVTHAKDDVVFIPAYWQCLIRSESAPSVEQQGLLCFSDLFEGQWVADNAPCAAPVMSDGTWVCDALTSWRYR